MQKRAEKLSNMKLDGISHIGTFHGLCVRLLRKDYLYELVGLRKDFHICDRKL